MIVKNIADSYYKIRYRKLSQVKTIRVYKDKKEIDRILKKWTSELRSLAWKTDTGLLASYNRFTETLIIKYRFRKAAVKQVCACDRYCAIAKLTANDNGTYELRYYVIYDRLLSITFKILGSAMSFPLIFLLFHRNDLDLGTFISLLVCAGLYSTIGVWLLLLKNEEKPEDGSTAVWLFENEMLMLL